MSTISPEALQLYEYMSYYRVPVLIPSENKQHDVLLVFNPSPEFTQTYQVYLSELHTEGWVKSVPGAPYLAVGYATLTHILFGQQQDVEGQINLLLSRYSDRERHSINEVLSHSAAQKNKTTLTDRQQKEELEYWNKFPVSAVMSAIDTYLKLPSDKQYGLRYLRGILRHEKQDNGTVSITTAKQPRKALKTPEKYDSMQRRSRYINTHLDEGVFDKLSPEERVRYIEQLETEFNAQAT